MMKTSLTALIAVAFLAFVAASPAASTALAQQHDVVVYGGTSAGVTAAVQAARMGKSVVIVCPDKHLGGLTSGGLGWTDTGRKEVIGGLAREFYHRVWQYYQKPETWKWQPPQDYGNHGQGTKAIDGEKRTMWIFEPHVAEQVFEDMTARHNIPVHRDQWLDRASGIDKHGTRIVSITTLCGNTYRGKAFIDASYEGDLMAAAGVSYHVGREPAGRYDEQFAGVQKDVRHHGHYFDNPISPYVVAGDPSSGLLPRVQADDPGENGDGDHRVQAYCFRMCLTTVPENRLPFAKPEVYDPKQYELLARVLEGGWNQVFRKFDPIPNGKTDTNNHGPFSTDNIGMNYDYPDADYDRRRQIIQEHQTYQKGLMYFLANDPRVPEAISGEMSQWGLAKDEFVDNGNWPHQIYVREARRMIGRYVMTEHDCLCRRVTPESVGMGSYAMDSHNVQRYVTEDGYVQNEGDVGVRPPMPYQIAFGSLQPQEDECSNLLVPVCLSSSHIAFGSVRMEPVFMILGQSAATAAVLAIEDVVAVQRVPYAKLRQRLLEDGQALDAPPTIRPARSIAVGSLEGIVIDDVQAKFSGQWSTSSTLGNYVEFGYRHDDNSGQGEKQATFEAQLEAGRYEVRMSYSASSNRADNVTVIIQHAQGVETVTVNQKTEPPIDGLFISLGEFPFEADQPATVVVSNAQANGHVIADAVQFVKRRTE